MSLVTVASKYVDDQYEAIEGLMKFEPIDETTAGHIESMMTAVMNALSKNNMIYDYQVKSSAIGNKMLYTSVIFNLKAGTQYIHLSYEITKTQPTPKSKDTAFDRAMKGI